MKIVARIAIAVIPGALITLALLGLMFAFLATGTQKLSEMGARKLADFVQPQRQVTQYVRVAKPEKKPAAAKASQNSTAKLKIGVGQGASRDSDYIPVYVPQPSYPDEARAAEVTGYAVVKVTITTSGAVKNPVLVEENPANAGFGAAALKAAHKLKYSPRVVDGRPQEVPDVQYKFTFQIE